MDDASELITIQQAAEQAAISPRTIQRWIRDGRISATQSDTGRRLRLVNAIEIAKLAASVNRRAPTSAADDLAEDTHSVVQIDYSDVVDHGLQLVYSHVHRLVSQTCPAMFQTQTIENLRDSPLGRDLSRLANVANGTASEQRDYILTSVESILQLLFWAAGADDYSIPRVFWDTELGTMLARAKARAFQPWELISIGATARRLGVARSTVYHWMDDRTLNYVRDHSTGRTFVVARDVDNLLRIAFELNRQSADS